jgi:hypothetical protein
MRRTRQSQDRVRGLIVEIGGVYQYSPTDLDSHDARQALFAVTSLQHELLISLDPVYNKTTDLLPSLSQCHGSYPRSILYVSLVRLYFAAID